MACIDTGASEALLSKAFMLQASLGEVVLTCRGCCCCVVAFSGPLNAKNDKQLHSKSVCFDRLDRIQTRSRKCINPRLGGNRGFDVRDTRSCTTALQFARSSATRTPTYASCVNHRCPHRRLRQNVSVHTSHSKHTSHCTWHTSTSHAPLK